MSQYVYLLHILIKPTDFSQQLFKKINDKKLILCHNIAHTRHLLIIIIYFRFSLKFFLIR